MEWTLIGKRIRQQREFLGYTREQFSELLGVTPKFCSDIELGVKGMSVPTLCKISSHLKLSVDYILFGAEGEEPPAQVVQMLCHCSPQQKKYAEELLKIFILASDKPH